MEMIQAKLLKVELENNVTKLVREFETQTGLKVDGFNLIYNQALGMRRSELIKIELETIFK